MVARESSLKRFSANDRPNKQERAARSRADVMTTTTSKISPSGLAFLLMTSVGWGLSWPLMKYVLAQWPPLSARGWTGVFGALALALYAVARGISLRVPRDQWFRVCVSAALNVALWIAVMGYALVFLPASEAIVIAYTMPVWTALLAWPLLGERMTLLRVAALVTAFAGLVLLLGGGGMSASLAKLPGIVLGLIGAIGFALGTIFLKKWPIQLPGATSAAWQIGIGCAPVAIAGLLVEHPQLGALDAGGWAGLAYMTFVQFCIAYVAWFAAVERLPASVAAIGTMLAPVIGVTVSAFALGEPLGPAKIAALVLTVIGVAMAARS
jgi:drug/metabolite transporter (DMT)-like permease